MGAFDKQIFKEPEVVEQIIKLIKIGSKTIYLLNTLILTDISVWKNRYLAELIEMFEGFIEEGFEKNALFLSTNPLMAISLTCELLQKISASRKRYEN